MVKYRKAPSAKAYLLREVLSYIYLEKCSDLTDFWILLLILLELVHQ